MAPVLQNVARIVPRPRSTNLFIIGSFYAISMAIISIPHAHPIYWSNMDEISYAAPAIELARTGRYNVGLLPDGLMKTQEFFAANPTLYPFASAGLTKLFGISRWAIRLPALAFFAAGLICLFALVRLLDLTPIASGAIAFSVLASPWLLQASTVGRCEMLSVFLCYAATLCAALAATERCHLKAMLFCAGALAAVGVWNGPLFFGVALLPVWLFIRFRRSKDNLSIAILMFCAGAAAAITVLTILIVMPHFDAWVEQFPRSSSSYAVTWHFKGQGVLRFALSRAIELKARFSEFGWPYIAWYVCCLIYMIVIFKPSRLTYGAIAWMLIVVAIIDLRTPTLFFSLIQFAAAVPILMCMASTRRRGASPAFSILIGCVAFISCVIHPLLIFQENDDSRRWDAQELALGTWLDRMSNKPRTVAGPAALALPSWKRGVRYLALVPPFFFNDPDVKRNYDSLLARQADVVVDEHFLSNMP